MEPHIILPNELTFIEQITSPEGKSGTEGTEYWKGQCRGVSVFIKKVKNQSIPDTRRRDIEKTLGLSRTIHHPNLVSYFGVCQDHEDLVIVTEFCEGGNLNKFLPKIGEPRTHISMQECFRIAKEMAAALAYLQKETYIQLWHGRLEPSKILFDATGTVKLAAWGLQHLTDESRTRYHTGPYVALEFRDDFKKNETFQPRFRCREKSDVYSFAMVIWQLFTQETLQGPILFKTSPQNSPLFRLPSLDNLHTPALRDLILVCSDKNPDIRPPFYEIQATLKVLSIEQAISDPEALNFWTLCFTDKESVPFDVFIPRFVQFFEIPEPEETDLACLREIIAVPTKVVTGEELHVHVRAFNDFIRNFGPIKTQNEQGECYTILDRMVDIVQLPGFHGCMSMKTVGSILKNYSPGYYLLRFSTFNSGYFTISCVTQSNSISNTRIRYDPSTGYHSPSGNSPTLQNIIEKNEHLVHPCPGSPFSLIFHPQKSVI